MTLLPGAACAPLSPVSPLIFPQPLHGILQYLSPACSSPHRYLSKGLQHVEEVGFSASELPPESPARDFPGPQGGRAPGMGVKEGKGLEAGISAPAPNPWETNPL